MEDIYNILSQEEKDLFKKEEYKKGSILFFEGDECTKISIIIKGEIGIISHTASGNTIYYNTLRDNEIFGNNLIFSSKPYYKGHVKALKDTTIININKEKVKLLLKNNHLFLETFLKINSDNTLELNKKIKILSFDSAKEKLLYFLKEQNNVYTYQSVTLFAKELFLSRETLSRLLSKMIKEKALEINKKTIFLKK